MSDTKWQFTKFADQAWESMYADCAAAKRSIDIEHFVFDVDEIGERFIQLFMQKARDGIRVRMLLDGARCYVLRGSPYLGELSKAGVQVQFFNPISPWRVRHFSWWPFRDHRKILVVDGEIGHTGGVGFNRDMKGWRDTNVRIFGPIVSQMERSFGRMWENTLARRFRRFRKPVRDASGFQFITNAPHIRQRFLYQNLIAAIRGATGYIYLTTPYFIPDLKFFRAIRLAAKRGVDVRILLPRTSDHAFVDAAAASYFGLALKWGVRFFMYEKSVLHTKTAVIDDRWSTVGSMNLDSLGFLWCHEANIVSTEASFARELKSHFEEDANDSAEVTRSAWDLRGKRAKLTELITWPFHKFL